MKMMPQQYCLRWKHHHSNVQSMFAQLLEKERFCDVTLYCSPSFASQVDRAADAEGIRGVSLRAHRVVLAACSELLGALLGAHESLGEPVLVIDGTEPRHLRALLDYMYTGEMNVHHSQLASLLKTAEELRIKGLTDIRWNNKDEPPDCHTGAVTTSLKKPSPSGRKSPGAGAGAGAGEAARDTGREGSSDADTKPTGVEKYSINGGPPPLIKLPAKADKSNPLKREHSDGESVSSKRQRALSGTEHTDDEDRDTDWHHANMDMKVERMMEWGAVGRGGSAGEAGGSAAASWERDASDDEWADAPADIGSFLHTRLRVDGDNSADEESNEEAPSTSSSAGASAVDLKVEPSSKGGGGAAGGIGGPGVKLTIGPKSGPTDPRFTDVVKLNDYLKHGRRPQFWEENYVKRVMEAVRIKELEMKQAAEILGVSYGTLYGRYRDVFGCINRPYRTSRDFWQAKGPSEVLDRLQRGEMTIEAGALALGVSPSNLAAYIADLSMTILPPDKEFEPIPIEVDPIPVELEPSQKKSSSAAAGPGLKGPRRTFGGADKSKKSVTVSSISDEDIPATVISAQDGKKPSPAPGKWPSIRIASIDSLRGGGGGASPTPTTASTAALPTPTSPSALMRTRPDLTIVAARKPDPRRDDDEGT